MFSNLRSRLTVKKRRLSQTIDWDAKVRSVSIVSSLDPLILSSSSKMQS